MTTISWISEASYTLVVLVLGDCFLETDPFGLTERFINLSSVFAMEDTADTARHGLSPEDARYVLHVVQ